MAGDDLDQGDYRLTPVVGDPFQPDFGASVLFNGRQAQPTISAYTPTLSERIGNAVNDAAQWAGASRDYAGSLATGARNVAGLVPGVGQAVSAYDMGRSGAAGNYGAAALAGLGVIPGLGSGEHAIADAAPGIVDYLHAPSPPAIIQRGEVGDYVLTPVFHNPFAGDYSPGLKANNASDAADIKKRWQASAPSDLHELIGMSPANQNTLTSVGNGLAQEMGVNFVNPGPKTPARILDKIGRGKSPQEVSDAVRGGFDTPTPQDADNIVSRLADHFEVSDEGWSKTPEGYFDRKAMVRFPNGQVGEVQMWPPGMLDAKDGAGGGHALYQAWQGEADPEARYGLEQKMRALYGGVQAKLDPAWQSVLAPK